MRRRHYIFLAPAAFLAALALFYPVQAGQIVAYGLFAAIAYKVARFLRGRK